MKIYYARKQKGRRCSSKILIEAALALEGLEYLHPNHLDSGAPVLLTEQGLPAQLSVSVTDTRNYIFTAISDAPLGIDAEEKGRQVRPSSLKALHKLEQTYLQGLETGSSEWTEEFLRIWTAKESYSKLCGAGLRMGFSTFSVVDSEGSYLKRIQKNGYPEGFVHYAEGPGGSYFAVCSQAEDDLAEFEKLDCQFPMEESVIEAAAKLLDSRAYSKKGLAEKLAEKGYSKEEAEKTALSFAERGYIDDESYALALAQRLSSKGSGKRKILTELEKKGFSSETARNAVQAVNEDGPSEKEKAMEAALRIWDPAMHTDEEGRPARPDEKTMARIARKLSALGYESSIIWDILNKLD